MKSQIVHTKGKPYKLIDEKIVTEWVTAKDINGVEKKESVSRIVYLLEDEQGKKIEAYAQNVKGVAFDYEFKIKIFQHKRL